MYSTTRRAARALASTCLTPFAFALFTSPAAASTTIDKETATPLFTSAAGDVTIADDGVIHVPAGAAITVDTDNAVTIEEGGEIDVDGADGATGIQIAAGTNSMIVNDGTISVTEDFTAADDDNNNIADGPIAQASDRYGIHVMPGETTSGSISNTGTITVEGLNSGGIVVDSAYVGDIQNTGSISIKGDGSVGIRTQDVNGNVQVDGTVSVVGKGAQGVVLDGDVSGTFSIQGVVTQNLTYTTDDGTYQSLSRYDLREGSAAVEVAGNVDGGIIIAAPPYNSDNNNDDEDKDGVKDSEEGTGSISSFGNSPALLIGGEKDITIGTVEGRDGKFSLVVDGSIAASASYSSTDAFGVVIGGQGGTVDLPGGIGVSGSITATTYDSEATAILINQGANVPYLYNSGTIKGSITSPGEGATYGVRDLSGTLTQVDNTGFISVDGSSEDTSAAIDLSANTTGVTINQYLNSIDQDAQNDEQAASDYDPNNAVIYTYIRGDILTGSGDDTLNIRSGAIYGDSYLAEGNDTVALSGDSSYYGDVHFGSGIATMTVADTASFNGTLDAAGQPATLTIGGDATFTGNVSGGSQLSVNVTGGSFGADGAEVVSFNTLTVGSGGTLDVYIDGDTGQSSLYNVNTATFESGATVSTSISSLAGAEGSYTILTSNSLTGASELDSEVTDLPVLFKGEITAEGNNLVLDITRKTAGELGLTRSQGEGYEAIYAAALADDPLGSSLLQVDDTAALQKQFDQLLPDHAGGVFDLVTQGSRIAARHLENADSFFDVSNVGGWVEPFVFANTKDPTGTAGYKTDGWGISTGLERKTGIGNLGLSLAYIEGHVKNGDWQRITVSDLELGAFWRLSRGALYAFVQGTGGHVSASSARTFVGTVDDADIYYAANGNWSGWTANARAGASYTLKFGGFKLRPKAVMEYAWLREDGYEESGSDVIDLTVAQRTSDSLTGTTTLTIGWSAGEQTADFRPFTVEVEGGRRNQLTGQLGATTANFVDGDPFTITPDALDSRWVAEARIFSGGLDYTWKLATGAEQGTSNTAWYVRASLSAAF